ncbi:DUF2851 family protein [Salegentibacter flavus]|uniref:DUF2851 domain-containing protein n=1 Tax=Salegentibacter flavus TaxID=287099 RepID=A0A1I4Y6P3_9FLAO|nr:DUF2851 family protein [Salegentibacter flavus]SFN33724.1 Protein of unknown function [Salegentibacter flavus]
MQEDFLHYLWKHKKFDFTRARTSDGQPIVLVDPGMHNYNSGPDFFNARIRIGNQLWAGNVEIHLRASDWYFHRHETDSNYDNVILHVVWEDNIEVYRKNNSIIPSLALSGLVDRALVNKYRDLVTTREKWINCEKNFPEIDEFKLRHWLERVYSERLENKSELILEMLKASENNWEAVLFRLLSKNFGLNVNGDAFLSFAQSFDFTLVQKCALERLNLEALFFGQAGFLEEDFSETYFENLKREYEFLRHKYQLKNEQVIHPKFFRLRPDNFSNIRLSQLASLYHRHKNLFSELIRAKELNSIFEIFKVETSEFWQTHYSFDKSHKKRAKRITNSFVDLVVINTVVPLKFCYARETGEEPKEDILKILTEIKAESNSVIDKFNFLRPGTARNALDSQAVLQLKNNYCDLNKCLNCEIGAGLLQAVN